MIPQDSYVPSPEQYKEFDKQLKIETKLLKSWFIENKFTENELELGSELEFFHA